MSVFRLILACTSLSFLNSCVAGHDDFDSFRDKDVGTVVGYKEVFRFENAGEFYRADFVIVGQGLTHITEDVGGNLIYHFNSQEVLPNVGNKEWIGKCLFYYVVEPETYVIKSWGFDSGGNPLSCRTWP